MSMEITTVENKGLDAAESKSIAPSSASAVDLNKEKSTIDLNVKLDNNSNVDSNFSRNNEYKTVDEYYNPVEIKQAIAELNDNFQQFANQLSFELDEKLAGGTIISILDSETGELIRQIPPKEVVSISHYIHDYLSKQGNVQDIIQGVILDKEV